MLKKYLLVIFVLLLLFGVFAGGLPAVRAVDEAATVGSSEETTEPDSAPNPSTTSQLKKRLERILGQEDNQAASVAGYLGEVTRVNEDALAVKTHASNHIIPLDETISLMRGNKTISVADISVGTWILAIGNRVKNGDVSPKTIVALTTPPANKAQLVSMGTIKEISFNTILFVPRGQTDPIQILSGRNSKLIDSAGETLTLSQLPNDLSVVVVAYMDPTGNPWQLSTLKSTVALEDLKNSPTPTPAPRRTSATPAPTPTPEE